jgi:hypothetical protein
MSFPALRTAAHDLFPCPVDAFEAATGVPDAPVSEIRFNLAGGAKGLVGSNVRPKRHRAVNHARKVR